MSAYYNEIDPYAAQWLRNLIDAGHIARGDVDERSIVDVRADDLRGYTQCHFFAGIGGWSIALRLAGWPDDRPVWTGSCPCQPFSAAGAGKAADDERHLWPQWFRLIDACRPVRIFGEQVASAAVVGLAGAETALCDGEPEEQSCLRIGKAREGAGEKERDCFRSGRLFDGDSAANRQRFVRSDGIAFELGWWSDLGQPIARSDRLQRALSLFEHSYCLPRDQQRDGRLGRAADGATCLGNPSEAQREIERIVTAIGREFEITPEWPWLDIVQSDLERAGYAVGSSVLPACGVGAPHIRQRLWFVADAQRGGVRIGPSGADGEAEKVRREVGQQRIRTDVLAGSDDSSPVADANGRDASAEGLQRGGRHGQRAQGGGAGELGYTEGGDWRLSERPERKSHLEPARPSEACNVGDPIGAGLQEQRGQRGISREPSSTEPRQAAIGTGTPTSSMGHADSEREIQVGGICEGPHAEHGRFGPLNGFWRNAEWIACTDGKARPVGPGSFPLGHGIQRRASKLRAYGNAIVPQVAAEFIAAAKESLAA